MCQRITISARQDGEEIRIKKPTKERYMIYNMSVGSNVLIMVSNKPIKKANITWDEMLRLK